MDHGTIEVGKALFQLFPQTPGMWYKEIFSLQEAWRNPAVPKQGIMEPLLAWDFSQARDSLEFTKGKLIPCSVSTAKAFWIKTGIQRRPGMLPP